MHDQSTTGKDRRITLWEEEHLIDEATARRRSATAPMTVRRSTVEHPFGTIKAWSGPNHFLTRPLKNVRTEFALNVPSYNIMRTISLIGIVRLKTAMRG